jgi:Tfp pilus assembly protein PilX
LIGITKMRNKSLRSQHGMVLMTSLMILAVLLAVGIGAGVMLRNDFQVLANLRGSTEAFYFSAAGVEWGKREIAQATTFPPTPANQSKSFSSGQFAVAFLSSTAVGPLAAQIVVQSTGTARGADHVLQAQLTKSYDLADAAVVLRGNAAGVNLTGNTIFVSGADHDPTTSNPIAGPKARSAVSSADDTVAGLIFQALGNPPRLGILESGPDTPVIATSTYLPAAFITQLADELCASASATVHSVPSSGGVIVDNQNWGNQTSPQLHCVDGLLASGDAVTLTGTVSGVGILVVKNADLIIAGTFRWDGLIIVTGTDISFKTAGPSSKDLLGAVLVNEAGIPGSGRAALDIEGTVRLLFSRQALSLTVPLIPTATINSAHGSLPTTISQNYWRAVTP